MMYRGSTQMKERRARNWTNRILSQFMKDKEIIEMKSDRDENR